MERIKKYVGFLLILIVALFFSQPVFAEENNVVTVGIRVETMDSTIIPLTYVTMPTTHKSFENYGLTGQTDQGFDTPVHVLAQYLIDNELATTETMSSMLGIEYNNLSQILTMYANGTDTKDASHFWMYMVNDDYPALNGTGYNMNDCPLKDGDVITIYAMSYPGTDYYAFFNKQKIEVGQGEAAKLTLLGRSTMGGNSSAISGAELISSTDGTSATVETGIVTDANGQASISFNETGIYTVSCKKDNITRACAQITVVSSDEAADKALVAEDKTALTIPSVTTGNLSLTDSGASGKTGITWLSNDPSVIQNDGKIIRGKADKLVTLTATIKKGTQTETKEFPVTIKAFSDAEIKQMLTDIKTALTAKTIRVVEGTDTNLLVKMQAQADLVTLGSMITLTDVKNQPQIGSDGVITYGSDASMKKEVTFKISLLDNEETGIVKVSVPAHTLTAQETVDDDAAQLTWDSIKKSNDAQDNVRTGLSLPGTGSSYATDITWEISNPAVIDKYGSVTRPAFGQADAKVTLTAIVAPGDYMEMFGHPGVAESKKVNIEVTVKAYTQEEYDAAKGDVAKVKTYLHDTGKIREMNTGAIADLSNIDYDLQLTGNDAKTTGVTDVDVAWSSTNSGITVNTYRGKVIRPGINGEKTVGKLVATISKSGYSETLEFDAAVLPLTQKEIDAENENIQEIAKKLTFDNIKKDNINSSYVISGLQMVYRGYCDSQGAVTYSTKNSGENGAAITWETSNADVIKTYGSVTRPLKIDANVIMTATISSIALKDVDGITNQKVEIPVTVIKPTAKLKNITLSVGTVTFCPDTYEYRVEIPEDITEATLSLTKFDSSAKVEVTGATVDENGNYLSKLDSAISIKSTLEENSAEYKINFITKDQAIAQTVIDQIAALPAADKLAISDKTAVMAARTAYDALSAAQKTLVTNLSILTASEAKIASLEPVPTPVPDTDTDTAKDKVTGIEVIGLPVGTAIKVVGETDNADKTAEAQKAAAAAGITDAKVVSLYDIKPDM
ncbi:hypothetical protein GH810_17010, partial [Acetobacterium paludosum]|nr:hypothetical protein [Acetobacterium paludosum]